MQSFNISIVNSYSLSVSLYPKLVNNNNNFIELGIKFNILIIKQKFFEFSSFKVTVFKDSTI